jgi:hypothetical protein
VLLSLSVVVLCCSVNVLLCYSAMSYSVDVVIVLRCSVIVI